MRPRFCHDRRVLADCGGHLVIDKPAKRSNVLRCGTVVPISIYATNLNGINKHGLIFLWINVRIPVNECILDRRVRLEDRIIAQKTGKSWGSSPNSGERRADFEEEVRVVAEAVSHAFDDFDLVVDPFEQAGV